MFHRTHQEMPRTNNHIKGWHRRFQGLCSCHHPGCWKFVEILKKGNPLNRVEIVQAEAGHPPQAQEEDMLTVTRRRCVNCNKKKIC